MTDALTTDRELWTRLSRWSSSDWIRRGYRGDIVRVSEDCERALDRLQEQAREIEQLRAKLERVERLAAGNITGCGTCSTILKEFPADVGGKP